MTQARVLGHAWLFATAAALVVSVTASAQAQSGERTLSATGQTFGQRTRELEIHASADATYDSNVLGARFDAASLRGLEHEDIILRPRLEGIVALPLGPVQFEADALVGYDVYTRNSELSSERIAANTAVTAGLTHCGGRVSGGYSRAQNNLRDLSIIPGDPITSSVNVQTDTNIGATAYCGAPVGLGALGFAEYRTSRNSNERRRYSNVNYVTYGGGAHYSNPVIGKISMFAAKGQIEYTDADPLLLFTYPDVDLFSVGARFDRRLGARLQLNGQVTYVKVDVEGVGGTQYDGVNWDISATLRAGDQLQLTVSTARQIEASSGFGANFVETSLYSASADYGISPRLSLNLSGSYQKRRFDFSSLIVRPLEIRNDALFEVSGRLNFQMSPRLSFSLFGSYENRDADIDIYDYDGFTAGIGARLKL